MRTNGRHLVATAIACELTRAGETVRWLSERSGIEQEALEAKLRSKGDFTMVDLANVARALGISVAALVPSRPPQP